MFGGDVVAEVFAEELGFLVGVEGVLGDFVESGLLDFGFCCFVSRVSGEDLVLYKEFIFLNSGVDVVFELQVFSVDCNLPNI